MAVLGQGIIPSGAIGTELTYITRRAFVPKMVVQIYNNTPLLGNLIGNSQPAMGGVSSVSVPVQGASFVNAQWSDYSGTFNQPAVQQGAYLGEYDLKLMIVPIPYLGMEGIVQDAHAVIPRIEATMNDSTNVACALMSNAIYNNTSDNSAFIGLPGAVDDGTNLTTYGNISRTLNTWWKSTVYNAGSVAPTRQNVMQYIAGTYKAAGEMPNFGVMGVGTWTYLAQDYINQEDYVITPGSGFDQTEDGPRSSFRALMVAGIPVFCDPDCPEGYLYLLNTNYINLYIHEQASFSFTGFESTLSNWQVGYVGAVLTVAELVNVKPKSCTRVGSYSSLSL